MCVVVVFVFLGVGTMVDLFDAESHLACRVVVQLVGEKSLAPAAVDSTPEAEATTGVSSTALAASISRSISSLGMTPRDTRCSSFGVHSVAAAPAAAADDVPDTRIGAPDVSVKLAPAVAILRGGAEGGERGGE